MPSAVCLRTVRKCDRLRPLAIDDTRGPNADIRFALRCAREPCSDQRLVLRLDDGRCVATRDGIRIEDELGFQDGGVGGLGGPRKK